MERYNLRSSRRARRREMIQEIDKCLAGMDAESDVYNTPMSMSMVEVLATGLPNGGTAGEVVDAPTLNELTRPDESSSEDKSSSRTQPPPQKNQNEEQAPPSDTKTKDPNVVKPKQKSWGVLTVLSLFTILLVIAWNVYERNVIHALLGLSHPSSKSSNPFVILAKRVFKKLSVIFLYAGEVFNRRR